MEYSASTGDRTFNFSIQETQEGLEVAIDGRRLTVDMARIGATQRYSLLVNGHSYDVLVLRNGENYQVVLDQRRYEVTVDDERSRRLKSLASSPQRREEVQEIRAAMPGLVVKVEVKEGDRVIPGDGLVIVEAMKMENEIRANHSGVVKQIFVHRGMTVDQGQTLVLIE